MQIVMTGRAGDVESYRLAFLYRELMKSRFPGTYIRSFEGLMHEGGCIDGVYQQLWRLGEEAGSGLEVRQEAIPIAQETIEICELLERDPYSMETSGRIYLLNDSERPAEGTVIGYLTSGNSRVIVSGHGRRFLTRPERAFSQLSSD